MARAKTTSTTFRSKAVEICQYVEPNLKAQAVTLASAVLTLQEKIEEQIPIYKEQPLAQEVTLRSGETVVRQNPMTQEFRATIRDYASSLKSLNEILESNPTSPSISPVDSLRNKFKVG